MSLIAFLELRNRLGPLPRTPEFVVLRVFRFVPGSIQYFFTIGPFLLLAILAIRCAPGGGDFGPDVAIPQVEVQCTTARCRTGVPAVAYVVYTTSSCTNPTFGQVASGNTTTTCTALGCAGRVTQFIGLTGAAKTQLASGVYNVCIELDFNNNYGGQAQTGEDTIGSLNSAIVREPTQGSTPLLSVSNFTDL